MEIADQAGVKKSLVMHHFTSKEQLWRDVVDDIYADVDRFFADEVGLEAPQTLADLRRRQRTYLRACFRFPGYVRIPLVEGTVDNERVRWLAERHIRRHHESAEQAYKAVAKHSRLPYDRTKFAAIKTGWVQILVANKPLYDYVAGKVVVTEKEMLKWSDQLFDLIFRDDSSTG